jgi:hypothetical protein
VKRSLLIALVAIPLDFAASSPARADTSLLPGSVANVTASCGAEGPLSVQFLGAVVSPLIEVPPGVLLPISLPGGLYNVTVTRRDGSLVEETRALVHDAGFRFAFGCARPPAPSDPAAGEAMVDAWLVNTSGACGDGREVEFLLDGRPAGKVADASEKAVRAPAGGTTVDAMGGGTRLLTFHLPRVAAGQSIVFGCTDPESVREDAPGVAVAFQNTTDACATTEERRHLTLWVDGLPRLGLPPGGKGVIRVQPGFRDVQVTVGRTRETVMRGLKDVGGPFRVRWGCGK